MYCVNSNLDKITPVTRCCVRYKLSKVIQLSVGFKLGLVLWLIEDLSPHLSK